MNKLFTLLLLLTLSFSAKSQTKAVTYAESGFVAAFTVQPKIERNELDTQLGKVNMIAYLSEGDDYMIMLSENRYLAEVAEKMNAKATKGMIDGAKNGAITNLEKQLEGKYKNTSNEDFLFNGKYTANKSMGTVSGIDLSTLCIMKGNQFYLLLVMGNNDSEAVTSFLKSFNLIENN